MGGMNLVIHAIVVVTIGVVTSRTVVSYLLYLVMSLLVINCKIKMNCKLAFKCITLSQIKLALCKTDIWHPLKHSLHIV